ncbi:MAG TPA: amidohydrolase family protein [Trebonia sp.]
MVVDGDRIVEVRSGWREDHGPARVVNIAGRTIMPGLIESHAHLTFPSAVGHIDPSFNPPLDVSFFHHIEGIEAELARAERNAAILLDEGAEYGIDRAAATMMGSVAALEAMTEIYPEIRRRGIRALPGGDYGFPNNPIGRNVRDLQLFVDLLGYSPVEALTAATRLGGQLMGMGDELGLLAPGYLADLLVVRGNPAEDVSLLQDAANLEWIVQGGRAHKQPEMSQPA